MLCSIFEGVVKSFGPCDKFSLAFSLFLILCDVHKLLIVHLGKFSANLAVPV